MPKFFTVTFGSTDDEQFAEPIDPQYEAEAPKCPKCGQKLANERWIPPYEVSLAKDPSDDIYRSFIGVELLTSEMLAKALAPLKGVQDICEVRVVKNGRELSPSIRLYTIQVKHSYVRVDFDACGVVWSTAPSPTCCGFCGPGGGGDGGCVWSFERIVLDLRHWDGEDIFYPINLAGTLIATGDAVRKAQLEEFPSLRITPIEEYFSSYDRSKTA